MKKEFPTYIDRSALDFEKIGISAGKQGEQLLLDPKILTDGLGITPAELTLGQ